MTKKTYTVQHDTPRLGVAGSTVEMTPKAAKYWLKAGVLVDPDAVKLKEKKTSSRKAKK